MVAMLMIIFLYSILIHQLRHREREIQPGNGAGTRSKLLKGWFLGERGCSIQLTKPEKQKWNIIFTLQWTMRVTCFHWRTMNSKKLCPGKKEKTIYYLETQSVCFEGMTKTLRLALKMVRKTTTSKLNSPL